MLLVTWNIQWGKGCDGIVDLARTVAVAKEFADADIFCFQEVSEHFRPLDGDMKQSKQLALLLPGYTAIFRPAVETVDDKGKTRRFGNMTFSRLPVLQVRNHLLPWPEANTVRCMQRHALEVTVQAPFGPLRVVNTHLEYYSAVQREAQLTRLIELQQEASTSPKPGRTSHDDPYRSLSLAPSGLLCGDFNFDVSDPQYKLITESSRPGLSYRDAWSICSPERKHEPTAGVFDHLQWSKGPDCRDFVFVTEDLTSVIRRVEVNSRTDASDHQPIVIELG
jgi:endonuclease/exonuclease/phosphatase family metal-dependent hydrolase